MKLKIILGAVVIFCIFFMPEYSRAITKRMKPSVVSIQGNKFFINGQLTYKERSWNGYSIEGLLMNSLMVQGIFDDLNRETAGRWKYPDTQKWDANRNTDEFVKAMDSRYAKGLLAFTINLQGGSPLGYGNRGWINSAFDPKGELRPAYMKRLERILNRANEKGMVVILGLFYNAQEDLLENDSAVLRGVDNAIGWLFSKNFRNLNIEVNNECNLKYSHAILQPGRVNEVIERIQSKKKNGYRFLVGTSLSGGKIPSGITLAGEGVETILFLDPELTKDFAGTAIKNASNELHDVTLRDFVVEGALTVETSRDPKQVRHQRSYQMATSRAGIIFSGLKDGQMSNINFEHITVRNNTHQGVAIKGAKQVNIIACDFSDNGSSVVPGAGLQHNLLLTHVENVTQN